MLDASLVRAWTIIVGSLVSLMGWLSFTADAEQVTLAWDASADLTVVGYNVYYGATSRGYTNNISAGQNTTVVISNLTSGVAYYFAATAIDFAGLESGFSAEVMYQSGKLPCLVTLTNLTQVYDGNPKTVTVITTPAGVSASLTYNGSITPPSAAGSYQVVSTITDSNYFGGTTNTLVISKATATIQLAGLNQTYDGTAKTVSVSTVPAGLAVNLTYNGSAATPINIGSYQVVASVNDPNYLGSAISTLVISKAAGAAQLLVSWPPNTNSITLFQSADLLTWRPLTNVLGLDGSFSMSSQPGAQFFMATSSGPLGTNPVHLSIRPF
jgi:hypothetical protein